MSTANSVAKHVEQRLKWQCTWNMKVVVMRRGNSGAGDGSCVFRSLAKPSAGGAFSSIRVQQKQDYCTSDS